MLFFWPAHASTTLSTIFSIASASLARWLCALAWLGLTTQILYHSMAGCSYFWGAKVTKTLAHLRWLVAQVQRAWTKCLIAEDAVLINYLFGGDNCLKASKGGPWAESKGKPHTQMPRHFIHSSATENERTSALEILLVALKFNWTPCGITYAMVGVHTNHLQQR